MSSQNLFVKQINATSLCYFLVLRLVLKIIWSGVIQAATVFKEENISPFDYAAITTCV